MRLVRLAGHACIGRAPIRLIQDRTPALIDLPGPLPSIPLFSPLLTPIINGNAQPTVTAPSALINLPVPIPSIPILSPLLAPIIAGSNAQSSITISSAQVTQTSSTGSKTGSGSGSENGGSTGGSTSAGEAGVGSTGGSLIGGSTPGGSASNGSTSSSGGSSGGGTTASGSNRGSNGGTSKSDGSAPSGSAATGSTATGSVADSGLLSGGSTGSSSSTSTVSGSSSGDNTGLSTPSGSGAGIYNDSASEGGSLSNEATNNSGSVSSNIGSSDTNNIVNGTLTNKDSSSSANSTASGTNLLSSTSGSYNLSSVSSFGGVANASGDYPPNVSGSVILGGVSGSSTLRSNGYPSATHSAGRGSSGTSSGGGSIYDPFSPNGGSGYNTSAAGHALSTGAIAAIVVVFILLLVSPVVFILRRRFRTRRSAYREQWCFDKKRNLQTYSDRNSQEILNIGPGSIRSSYATTYGDQLETHRLTPNFDMPPMTFSNGILTVRSSLSSTLGSDDQAHRWLTPNLSRVDMPLMPPVAELRSSSAISEDTGSQVHRLSGESVGSGYSEFLVFHQRTSERGSPVSSSACTPNELFAFPRPPDKSKQADWFANIRNLSMAPQLPAVLYSSGPLTPIPITPLIPNVFIDANSVGSATVTPNFSADSSNPFSDPLPHPTPSPGAASTAMFSKIETVKRPFHPTLHSELRVSVGNRVCIQQLFEDGWAMVTLLADDAESTVGKWTENQNITSGLIPSDCLREVDSEMSAALDIKRVSSYSNASTIMAI